MNSNPRLRLPPGAVPSYSLSYRAIAPLTRLGWVVHVPLRPGRIEVLHGGFVETADAWFVEGCWDGPLPEADFDRSDCFFGSGLRLRDGSVSIVASRATVDSIVYCLTDDFVIASNSLILLLSAIGATLNEAYSYEEEFSGALRGIRNYKSTIPVVHPSIHEIRQLYFGNLEIADCEVTIRMPEGNRQFARYEDYIGFLVSEMSAIHANATSSERRFPMNCFSTLSTGYDSTAVTVLAKKYCGVDRCITTEPNSVASTRSEDARPLAKALALEPFLIAPASVERGSRELYYYAANFQHFEPVYDAATRLFEAEASPTLLFTGYHGDKVWAKRLPARYLNDDVKRGDMSGKGLSEIRLKAGFVNAPLPFLGARQIRQIVTLSNSAEMVPWSVGGDYDRPIPRRICEEAGLPRESFGQAKHKITSHKAFPSDSGLRAEFVRDLKSKFGIGRGRLWLYGLLDALSYRSDGRRGFDFLAAWKRSIILGRPNIRMLLFIWATNRAVADTKLERGR